MLKLSVIGWFHTTLSLIALLSGIAVVAGLVRSQRMGALTALFMASAIATSLTAFGFAGFGAGHWIAVISLALLAVAVYARYVVHLEGIWRGIYAVAAVYVLYFLVFVTIAEAFKRVPILAKLAPTGAEMPFKLAEAAALAGFIALAILTARRFRYVRAIPKAPR